MVCTGNSPDTHVSLLEVQATERLTNKLSPEQWLSCCRSLELITFLWENARFIRQLWRIFLPNYDIKHVNMRMLPCENDLPGSTTPK